MKWEFVISLYVHVDLYFLFHPDWNTIASSWSAKMGVKSSRNSQPNQPAQAQPGQAVPAQAQPGQAAPAHPSGMVKTAMQGPQGLIESGLHTPLPVDTAPYLGPRVECIFINIQARMEAQGGYKLLYRVSQ